MKTQQLKLIFAGVGVGAIIAMGALGAVFAPVPAGTGTVSQEPDMTLGETTTSTTANTELETPAATPEVTAEPAPTAD
ncbi:hypothetical protein ABQF17_09630 [Mycolicibacterium elephantis]|uniref:Uncharacterized protein n=1 Tax=Mycolicibacterium elephantis TaxID=81858 RepID=A0A1A0QP17_9MYCO|nr:hypothetical protein [Mycolicibacterium elephantis]OBB23668.1 hypothetical protein A5762_13645 [Mycolicibacterium elephantis]OBE96838.1 hypothetical protein A5776_18175 [Mycolicibacterium elephantis]ORA66006.1 hypothetical protein BST23_11770 [Mycolicibacterium elephantis]